MSGPTGRGQSQPKRYFLRDLNHHRHVFGKPTAGATFVQQIAYVGEQLRSVFYQPPRTEGPSGFLIRCGDVPHISIQRLSTGGQSKESLELNNTQTLGINRTASVDVAVNLVTGERIDTPVIGICLYHINVMQQHQGRCLAAIDVSGTGQLGP